MILRLPQCERARGLARSLVTLALAVALMPCAMAVTLAPVFRDRLIFQGQRLVPIWGAGEPGEQISVEFAGHRRQTRVGEDGRWRVELPPLDFDSAGDGQPLLVRGANELRIEHVLVGEVWLVVAPLGGTPTRSTASEGASANVAGRLPVRRWHAATADWITDPAESPPPGGTVVDHFAHHLRAHRDVPIGLIDLSVDHAPVLAYAPEEGRESTREGSQSSIEAAGALFDRLVRPLAPFPVRGVLWFHGGPDVAQPRLYADGLITLIAHWRAAFEQLELPFLVGNLPSSRWEDRAAEFRHAQARVAGDVLRVTLVNCADLGDCTKGGSWRSFEIGERFARAARAQVYGERLAGAATPGPGRTWVEADEVMIDFNHVAGGLVAISELEQFELVDAAGAAHAASARLVGPRTVALRIQPEVTPVGVRFGWTDCYLPTLHNREGLPPVPFRLTLGGKPSTDPARWARVIQVFVQQDALRAPPRDATLFIGSSSIRGWTFLARDFEDRAVINRGFGGSFATDSVYYFDQIVRPYRPRTIVFYAGENDIAVGRSAEDVARTFAEFSARVQAALPETQVLFLAMKPSLARWDLWDEMKRGNALVADYCRQTPRHGYIDTASPLLDAEGRVREPLFQDDGLHLNLDGYVAWREVVRAALH